MSGASKARTWICKMCQALNRKDESKCHRCQARRL